MASVKKGLLATFILAAAVALSGCQFLPVLPRVNGNGSGGLGTGDTGDPTTATRRALGTESLALITGFAIGPASLVGNNSAGLVGNNSAGLVGNNSAGLVGNNSAGFRILGLPGEARIEDAVVYLTDPSGRFFKNSDGDIVTTKTDKLGVYTIADAVPTDTPVIVNVVLAEDRREVGFTVPQKGKNEVNVSLATTIVTEFLRERANVDKKSMAKYDLAALPDLATRTEKALLAGEIATPSLRIGDIGLMNRGYTVAIGSNTQGLGDAWAQMLGYRIVAGVTYAGTGNQGGAGDNGRALQATFDTPKGLAMDADGNVYVSEEGGHRVRKIDKNGIITTVAGTGTAGYSGNGLEGAKSKLNWPRTVAVGPDGNLYIADVFNMRIRALALKTGTSFGVAMTRGNLYDIVGDPVCIDGQGQCLNGYNGSDKADQSNAPPARRTGTITGAQLAGVRGITFDSKGNLIFTDAWGWNGKNGDPADPKNDIRHHIRLVAANDGTYYGVQAAAGRVYTIFGKDGTYGFEGDAPRPALGTPGDYMQSIVADADDTLYFTDPTNYRVRKLDTKGYVSTLAGSGEFGKSAKVTAAGDGGPATQAKLVGPYGLGIDKTRRLLYVSTRFDGLIRAVNLTSGTIKTVAGAGAGGYTSDGDARQITLNNPHDLLVLPDGSLLETNARGHKLFRFLTQWGF
ncbi:MAG: hypothetical protein FJZ01_20210 [Candidatus Sericytochromatia bacterium]|nr:hypothetical protein [Candidatus Tanganyikabacteria bacterium]